MYCRYLHTHTHAYAALIRLYLGTQGIIGANQMNLSLTKNDEYVYKSVKWLKIVCYVCVYVCEWA